MSHKSKRALHANKHKGLLQMEPVDDEDDNEAIMLSSPRSQREPSPPLPLPTEPEPEEVNTPKLSTLLELLKDAGDRVRRLMDPTPGAGNDWELLENWAEERPEILCFRSRSNARRFRLGGLVHASAQHLVARLKQHNAPDPPGRPTVRAELLHSYSDNVEYVRFAVPMTRGFSERVLMVAQHTTYVEDSHSYVFTMVSVPDASATATVCAGVSVRQLDDGAGCEVVVAWEYELTGNPWVMEWWVTPEYLGPKAMTERVQHYAK